MSSEWIIGASVDELAKEEDVFKKQDPFTQSWDSIKSFSGLDANFKRRASRIAKSVEPTDAYLASARAVPAGQDGAQSNQINPGTVFRNGYGMFDVITPPWNLYELANYYDTSFANHAAIDAKVENIVGLGYDFEISQRTVLRLESNTDEASTDRARKRIERSKIELRDWLENLNQDDSFTGTMMNLYRRSGHRNGYLEVGRK